MRDIFAPNDFVEKIDGFWDKTAIERICSNFVLDFPRGLDYTVHAYIEIDHDCGADGFFGVKVDLQKNGIPVMVSIHFIAWETSSDDSWDRITEERRETFLLQEDQMAKRVFERIRPFRPSREVKTA